MGATQAEGKRHFHARQPAGLAGLAAGVAAVHLALLWQWPVPSVPAPRPSAVTAIDLRGADPPNTGTPSAADPAIPAPAVAAAAPTAETPGVADATPSNTAAPPAATQAASAPDPAAAASAALAAADAAAAPAPPDAASAAAAQASDAASAPALVPESAAPAVAAASAAPPTADATSAAAAPGTEPGGRTLPGGTGTAPLQPPPVYAVQLPPPVAWPFRIRRGMLAGQAELRWQPQADGSYAASLQAQVAGITVLDWASRGRIDAHGVAPDRFAVQRLGRDTQAASFQRDKALVTYSGPSVTYPLWPGAQDRLSWMVQLAGIVAADPARFAPGTQLTLFVTGARGDADVWTFLVIGPESVTLPLETRTGLKLARQAGLRRSARAVQADVWLDPAHGYLPMRAVLTAADGGEPLEMVRLDPP